MNKQLTLNRAPITSDEDLSILVFSGQEGIGETHLGKLTYEQYCSITAIEDSQIEEKERLQRLVQNARAKGITDYALEREDSIFPEVVVVLGSDAILTPVTYPSEGKVANGIALNQLTISKYTDRFIVDGQGRRLGIERALLVKEQLKHHHIDVKFWIAPTPLIYDSANKVRQIFADFHLKLRKPSLSQSIYFDKADPLNVFAWEVMQITTKRGVPLRDAIAIEGRLAHGQFLNMATLVDFCCCYIGDSPAKVRQALSDKDVYDHYLLEISDYWLELYRHLRYESLISGPKSFWVNQISNNLFCCVIGLKALALLGNSISTDAKAQGHSNVDFSSISKLVELPMLDKSHQLWTKNQIYQTIENKHVIVKGSERRLARLLCTELRVIASRYCNS